MKIYTILLITFLTWAGTSSSAQVKAPAPDMFSGKPRVVVLTDIGNEPDDQMSFVRLLLYSNEIDIEALVATTSTWQKTRVQPETLREIVAAYAEVRPNLLKHASGWPEASRLVEIVTSGQAAYGMAATGPDKNSGGSEAIVKALKRDDPRPLWISVWGGANTLAQALISLRATESPAELEKLLARLRVYSISDQDDAGPWIRKEFPNVVYVVKPSSPDGGEYATATWTGISGDVYYRNCQGADGETVTNEWLERNIRAKGPLGKHYLKFAFIMEGDTPSFLFLTNNGLNSFRSPSWGGWGGRYVWRRPYGETHPIWTQGGDAFDRTDSRDAVAGKDGHIYVSDQATIWRWRTAYQHDFAARMDWTIRDYENSNHAPRLVVNGLSGTSPVVLDVETGRPITLDAGASSDPDGNRLSFNWYQYSEAGYSDPSSLLGDLTIGSPNSASTTVIASTACRPQWLPMKRACAEGLAHLILEVKDNGRPSLTSYRRIILRIHPASK